MKRGLPIICLVLLSLTAGCQDRPEPVTYTEPVPETNLRMTGHSPDDVHNHSSQEKQLTWALPSGWTESKSSGMILSKITAPDVAGASITLAQLGGTGGGINPNIQRWAGQLRLSRLSDAELAVVQQPFGHDEAKSTLIDFNVLPSVKEASMKVCILEYTDFTLYLKATGSREAISAISDQFLILAQSISYK